MSFHWKLFVPLTEQYAATVLSAIGADPVNSEPLTCFLSSLRRFISAAFSSLVMPTRLGCVVFTRVCCGAGGVAVGDRLGVACLRGVITRDRVAAKNFDPTPWLIASRGSTYSRLEPVMVLSQAVRRRSRVPGRVQFRRHLE